MVASLTPAGCIFPDVVVGEVDDEIAVTDRASSTHRDTFQGLEKEWFEFESQPVTHKLDLIPFGIKAGILRRG